MKKETIRLYHYTKAENLIKILSSGVILLSHQLYANDPFEGTICHPKISNEIDEKLCEACSKEAWHSLCQESPTQFICLSSKISSPSMWGLYADSHRGVCLVFDVTTYLTEEGDSTDPLDYKNICPCFPIKYVPDKPLPQSRFHDFRKDFQWINREASVCKGIEWAYEKEVRIEVTLEPETLGKNTDVVEVDGRLGYKGIMGCLKGVILGSRNDTNIDFIKKLLEKYNYDGVFVAKAMESPTKYKMEVKNENGEVIVKDSNVRRIRRKVFHDSNGELRDKLWFVRSCPKTFEK